MARIFVIDDDEQLLRMVGLMLERGGHNITLINNPLDGLEQIKADKPDLLVLDVMMPNMDGLTVCEKLRAQAETAVLPIILLSARTSPESVKDGMEAGATRYLGKPISREELIQTLRDVLENIPSA